MTIFVHIGLNKTGSSSLQAFCHLHRALLADHGLEYPKAGIHGSAHYGVSKLLTGRPSAPEVPLAAGLEGAIRSAVAARRNVLLSSEYFFLASDEEVGRVKTFLAGFQADSRVIVYLRRHDLWIASLFNQALKTARTLRPWHTDIRNFTIRVLGDRNFETRYPVIVDRWAAQFGAANLIVRPFEAAQFMMGEYIWDVLGHISDELPPQLKGRGIDPMRINESVPEPLLQAIAGIKASAISDEAKKAVTALLLKEDLPPRARKKAGRMRNDPFVLPLYLKRAIVNLFAKDYRYIAERYLGSKDGVLFREPVRLRSSGRG